MSCRPLAPAAELGAPSSSAAEGAAHWFERRPAASDEAKRPRLRRPRPE